MLYYNADVKKKKIDLSVLNIEKNEYVLIINIYFINNIV
jgi:hypothetical protein